MGIDWALKYRLATIRVFRQSLVEDGLGLGLDLVAKVERPAGEVWASEFIPLLEACRFLEVEASKLLATKKAKGRAGLAFSGLKTELARRPYGKVLIIGPFNYPLFLPGTQCLQALVAGNQVIWKPGRNGKAVADAMRDALIKCGMPPEKLSVTDETAEAGMQQIEAGVDLIIFTGSAEVGKKIAAAAAEKLTPCIIEASGSDAMILTESADLERAAKCFWFGLTINGGQTCISPRRVFVPSALMSEFIATLLATAPPEKSYPLPTDVIELSRALIEEAQGQGATKIIDGSLDDSSMGPTLLAPLKSGSKLFSTDLFAPLAGLVPYESKEELFALEAESPFALGASIFGKESDCKSIVSRISAACVTINDCVAPTADPRASFGGNKLSGYGRTRGAAGLLACTTEQTIITRKGKFLPHLIPGALKKVELFKAIAGLSHKRNIIARLKQIPRLIKSAKSDQ